jgi:hypothetical protein
MIMVDRHLSNFTRLLNDFEPTYAIKEIGNGYGFLLYLVLRSQVVLHGYSHLAGEEASAADRSSVRTSFSCHQLG